MRSEPQKGSPPMIHGIGYEKKRARLESSPSWFEGLFAWTDRSVNRDRDDLSSSFRIQNLES